MGRNGVLTAGPIGLAVAIAGCAGGANVQLFPQPPAADRTVNVEVLCPSPNAVTVNVDDWEIEVQRGYGVNWAVTGDARVQIIANQGGTWPFPNQPTVQAGNTGFSGSSANNATPARHKYTMLMTCQRGNNAAVVLRIDPDIIITE